jgi:hypothetical protein
VGVRSPKVGEEDGQTALRVATHEQPRVEEDGAEEVADGEVADDSGIGDSGQTQGGLDNAVGALVGDVGETGNTGNLRNGPGTEASQRAMEASCSP